MQSKIILPLDNIPWDRAKEILKKTKGLVWGYKIRRSVLEKGLQVVKEIKEYGNVMLDFKLFDIPSAMTESLDEHLKAGADITTVHCTSCYDPASFGLTGDKIAGVTILTSMQPDDYKRYYRGEDIPGMVEIMAKDASSYYDYLVCSPMELNKINRINIKKICPGIRPVWYQEKDDQHRTSTPYEAIARGAHLLVIGRPLLNASSIEFAIKNTNEEIWKAL